MSIQVAEWTTHVVSSYVAHNPVAPGEMPDLIRNVYRTLHKLWSTPSNDAREAADETAMPGAVKIRRSITPDGLVSFIDGKPYKMLKRHLSTNGLTPAAYRATFGLPDDYPMTAPNYSLKRSAIAKDSGLGFNKF